MKTTKLTQKWGSLLWLFGMQLCFLLADCTAGISYLNLRKFNGQNTSSNLPQVKLLLENKEQVVMDNGIVRVTFSRPGGIILGVSYNGINNVLDDLNKFDDRGYFDIVWNIPGITGFKYSRISGTKFSIIEASENQVELSFSREWDMGGTNIPLNIDKRYILRRGSSGFYMYAIMERKKDFPALEIDHIRIVFKLDRNRFNYMAIANDRQRVMPSAEERGRGKRLGFAEAVLITNSTDPKIRGEVDDKYQYSSENQENSLHGWVANKSVGFWMITPSSEFRNGGPIKQGLTSHVGPTMLNILHSTHYAGKEATMAFQKGETFKKVYGPVFVYLNSIPNADNPYALWADASRQLSEEVKRWPYNFPKSNDFLPPNKRGSVEGTLQVQDRGSKLFYGDKAYVGLALPGDVGSWQRQSKGYQFWTRANKQGYFRIANVVPGDYNLYAWIPGVFGDYKYNSTITVNPGDVKLLGSIIFTPPRNGPTVWEIGIPDRSAAEFYVPDPYSNLTNRLYLGKPKHRFRQYGLWQRYGDLYPLRDLVYQVGISNYKRDWFYAHVTRNVGNNTFKPTTWEIRFNLTNVIRGNYTLQLALASAATSNLAVRINKASGINPLFGTGPIGQDNSIARHGIHGLYWPYSIQVPSLTLVKGVNSIYLRQTKGLSPFPGIMYDYIRLESPSL